MKVVKINLGAKIGRTNILITESNVLEQFGKLGYKLNNIRTEVGTYDGVEEKTYVISMDIPKQKDIKGVVSNLTDIFGQECIPYLSEDGESALVYNPEYQGERMSFDINYFIK